MLCVNFAVSKNLPPQPPLRDTHTRTPPTRILVHNIHDEKWKYEATFFLAKNKNEDSNLGWTADLKINLDKL